MRRPGRICLVACGRTRSPESATSPSTSSREMGSEAISGGHSDMNLASIRPSFIVKDLEASITYYRERLGFQLDFQGPDEGPFWAGVSRDGIGIMLKAVGSDVQPIPNHNRHE